MKQWLNDNVIVINDNDSSNDNDNIDSNDSDDSDENY